MKKMYNIFTSCLSQLCSATGVKVPDFERLQLQGGSQIKPIAGYLTGPDSTTVHTESPIAALQKQSSPLGPDQAGDPPSSPPQIKVQATTEAHTEPLRASPPPEISEPANACISTVKHNQSSPIAHEAADRNTAVHTVTHCDAT
jgi:hypothetical protein